jgi:hypothetical protein
MRSSQIYRALHQIPNRFALCQTISQGARHIHLDGEPFSATVTAMLEGVRNGTFRSERPAPSRDSGELLIA